MSKTTIEWTEQTWNPVAGCTWASAGCDHCYAAVMTRRLEAMGKPDYAGLTTPKHFNGVIRTLPDKLDVPLRRKKPTRWFVNSMSDLFHKDVPDHFIADVFATMYEAQWHTFQVLTKRPERMATLLSSDLFLGWMGAAIWRRLHRRSPEKAEVVGERDIRADIQWPLPNVWLGTSVENQEQADKRIPHLLRTPAAVRFLSIEPLLGAVKLPEGTRGRQGEWETKQIDRDLHWVIVGGESGPHARPMHPDWARSLRDQCQASGVPFFFKQWGEWMPAARKPAAAINMPFGPAQHGGLGAVDTTIHRGEFATETPRGWAYDGKPNARTDWHHQVMARVGKKAAGRLLDGREWNEMPEVIRG